MEKILEIYKELYYKEIEYSDRLNSKISTCITFLTIIGSGVIFAWSQLSRFQGVWEFGLYLFFCVISSVLFVVDIVMFYFTYSGYKINYFPIEQMAVTITETYDVANKNKISKDKADERIDAIMAQRFVNDAINNRQQNLKKNKRHRRLIRWISVSFMVLLITYAIAILINNFEPNLQKDIQYVQIVEEVNDMANDRDEIVLIKPSTDGVEWPEVPRPQTVNESFDRKDGSTNNSKK